MATGSTGCQVLALALYVYLLFAALQRRAAFPLADLFFRLDPLAALLASRAWIPRLALALVTLGLTLVFGRVWCGWLCPLGTLLEWVRFRETRFFPKNRVSCPALADGQERPPAPHPGRSPLW